MSPTRSVLVTGASTGIGRAVALRLAARGFRVFGTVRRIADGGPLAAAGVTPQLMDVTDPASIAAAKTAIANAQSGEPLWALVNNAGVSAIGPIEHVDLAKLRRVFEVNVIGAAAVTQAFLPQLRAAKGRIVLLGSVAGLIAPPYMGPYVASKFALEGLADSLRRELRRHGVQVTIFEPGPIESEIWRKAFDEFSGEYGDTVYLDGLRRLERVARDSAARALPAEAVARSIERALASWWMPRRMVISRHRWALGVVRRLPAWLLDRFMAW